MARHQSSGGQQVRERIFGKRPAVGASMLDLLASQPEQQAAVKAVWSRALAGRRITEIGEFGDRERIAAPTMRCNTLRDRDGNRIGAYQFVYDVTRRVCAISSGYGMPKRRFVTHRRWNRSAS